MEVKIVAGYNRGIVATRKLNKENKARLGRRGADGVKDTKIRKVAGRDSHVNALEAYLIDVDRKAGEDYAKRVGAGTTNPLTGMPEYHGGKPTITDWLGHPAHHGGAWTESVENLFTEGEFTMDKDSEYTKSGQRTIKEKEKEDIAQELTTGDLGDYQQTMGFGKTGMTKELSEFGITADQMQFLTPFTEEPYEFLEEQQALTTGRALETKGFTEKGLLASKEAAGRQAGIATAGITAGAAGTREALGRQLSAGSRAIGQGMAQARSGAESAAAKSGFARSGTVTGAMGQQMKALTQDYGQMQADYAGGLGAATRQANIGLAGVRADEQTAAETYTLGMEGAAADYTYATDVADLDFRQAEYLEKQRQKDLFYEDIRAIKSWG